MSNSQSKQQVRAGSKGRGRLLTIRWFGTVAALMMCHGAWALGLGEMTVRSYLGQPLTARIELLSNSPVELEGVTAALASSESFRLIGLDRMNLSVPLAFTVHPELPDAYIEVRSTSKVSDPVLRFVVEVSFANGRLLREYTVFLDPPSLPAPVPLPDVTPRPRPAAVEQPRPVVESEPAEVESSVEEQDAGQEDKALADAQTVEAAPAQADDLVDAAPENTEEPAIESGVETVDDEEALTQEESSGQGNPEVAEEAEVREQLEAPGEPEARDSLSSESQALAASEEEPPVTPVYQASMQDLETYGPVQTGQTLWSIASEVSAGSGYSVNQAMLAIQRYNPEAFAQGNINLLQTGSILRLPPESEYGRVARRQAMLEAIQQAEDYADILLGLSPEPRPAPMLADGESQAERAPRPVTEPDAELEGRLELVPPEAPLSSDEPGTGSGAEGEGLAGAESGEGDLLSEEEIATAAQEAEYLSERLKELEAELGPDDPAVEVTDSGMAELESRLREERETGAESPPVVVAPPQERTAWYATLGWWVVVPLVLLVAVIAWWLSRRRNAADTDVESAVAAGSATDTARAIAGEAEDILKTLEGDVGPASDGADGSTERPVASAKPSRVIDLEDYIGHEAERQSETVEERSAEEDQDDETEEPDEKAEPADDKDTPFWQGEDNKPVAGGESFDPMQDEPSVPPVNDPEPVPEDDDDDDDDGEALELDSDDPETKLDLARAYISMGDGQAAREMLEEVIAEGNEDQVTEARTMLEEI